MEGKLLLWPVRVLRVMLAAAVLCLAGLFGVGLAMTSDEAAVRWVGVCLCLAAVASLLLFSALGRAALTRSSLVLWLLGAVSLYTAFGTVQAIRNASLPPWAAATVGVLGITCAIVLLLGGVLYEKTRTAIFSGATDVFNVLMLQAVTPAPWVDFLERSYLVVVPHSPLDTTTFGVSREVSSEVIRNAKADCLQQLEQILAGSTSYQAQITVPEDVRVTAAVAALTKQIFASGVSRHRL